MLALALIVAVVMRARGGGRPAVEAEQAAASRPAPAAAVPKVDPLAPRPAPLSMRGLHVTMALASIPGKLDEYLKVPGLNTVQLDVKDENGDVGFVPSAVPFAKAIGAAKPYYKPRQAALLARKRGVYLIGRIVCFEDPVLSAARPAMAVQRTDGSRWVNHAGLGWADPYNRDVWRYIGDLAVASARLGFDEIQLDYVRFPTDGDVEAIRYPSQTTTPMGWVVPEFVQYVATRLKPTGARLSADVFGLSATRDLGIGQIPRRISRYLDAIYPMVYPSHYGPGEHGLDDPNASPGPDRRRLALRLQPRARGPADEDHPVAAGLLVRPHVHRGRGEGADRRGGGRGVGRLPALERRGRLQRRRLHVPADRR